MRRCCASVLLVALAGLAPGAARAETVEECLGKARKALEDGQPDKALEWADKAVAADPKEARGYLMRGIARGGLHKHREALADLDKAIGIDPRLAAAYDHRGSEHFKLGHIKESLADFDHFLELKPAAYPGHWRRGITLYYAGKYEEGRKQFAAYEKEDTNDVENSVWHYLCAARVDGIAKARTGMLKIGRDRRVPMMEVYDLFLGKLKPGDVLAAAEKVEAPPAARKQALFYAHLYLGLYYDATGDKAKALEHMKLAAGKYNVGQYMADVARVHEQLLRKDVEKD
jgi:lipoprotein NlpI